MSVSRAVPILLIGWLAGCVAHTPLLHGTQLIVPAKVTTGLNSDDATHVALTEAARITVDHGYRYFALLPLGGVEQHRPFAMTPGTPVRVQLLQTKHSGDGRVWDAYAILQSHSLAR